MMKNRRDSGSVMISVLVVLLIASAGALALTQTLLDYSKLHGRQRDILQAFRVAETGAMEVVAWFNTSGTVISQINPDFAALFRKDPGAPYNPYPALDETVRAAGAPGLDVSQRGTALLPSLQDARGESVGEVTSLYLYHPDFDPLAGEHEPVSDIVCIVRSVGQTKYGAKKTVWLYLNPWGVEGAPAAIVSKTDIGLQGNARPHWGQVWTKDNLEPPSESQTKLYIQGDPWIAYRSEGLVTFNSTWGVPKWGVPYYTADGADIVSGTSLPTDGIVIRGTDYTNRTYQSQTLPWPEYRYDRFKNLAKQKGRYYGTDASGNVYRDGIIDDAHRISSDLEAELNVGTMADRSPDPAVWGRLPYDVVFIDTIDQQPPAADGSNLASLSINGGGTSWKGFYYICANVAIQGSPTTEIPARNPDGAYKAGGLKAFCDGILVSGGTMDVTGNPVVYGSCFAFNGYTGSGTLDVYYNARLADGFPAPLHPMVASFFKVGS